MITARLPPGVYDTAVAVTGAPALRLALWRLALASLVVVLSVWLIRRTARSSAERIGTLLAPYVGGAAVAVAATVLGPVVLERLLQRTAGLSGPAASVVQSVTTGVESVGPGPVSLAVCLVLAGAAIVVTHALWFAFVLHVLPERTGGTAAATAGLFLATAFGAVLGAPRLVVFGGFVLVILVWDTGSFGTVLRREVGAATDSRRLELVHASGTAAVGGVGVALTLGVLEVAPGSITVASDLAYIAILTAVAAIVALTIAVR